MKRLEHFLWFCSLTTGGLLVGFVTFIQSIWQGLTIWTFYEQKKTKIDKLNFELLKKLFKESDTMLYSLCGLWSIFILASIVSAGMLVFGTMNVSVFILIN